MTAISYSIALNQSTKIVNQVRGNTLRVTTRGRNRFAPNVKTTLNTIIGLLDPDVAVSVIERLHRMIPENVVVEGETGKIVPLEIFEELPELPRFNPEGGTGYLAAEEKLKAPLFDPLKKDVRVLVEHRSDPLVTALNKAIAGRPEDLNEYIAAFKALDKVHGDRVFERWFL